MRCHPFGRPTAAIALLLLIPSAAFPKDAMPTSVFDLNLGEPFEVRECKYEIVEQEMGIEGVAVKKRNRGLFGKPDHVSRSYRYLESKPTADKCFQRVGPSYTSAPLPGVEIQPIAPPNNQKVKLVYADSLRPALADSDDIWVGIQNFKLTGVRFYFQSRNEQGVFQALLKKYGPATSKDKFTLSTPAGEVKTFYSAKWSLPRLQVTFLSLDTGQIGYDPQDAPIGHLSQVGSVTVQYKVQETVRPDNNPL